MLASFLHLLGVPGKQIPDDLDGRAALYRDRMHDRHALVLLDNAASEQQVLPLLPAGATSLVLITSRRVLALDGARALTLDVFTPQDADALLTLIAADDRPANSAAAHRVTDLCGRLPLAVALAARRLRSRPAWGFDDLAARLEEERDRLGELAVGTRQVRAVFDMSYRALDPAAQRLFRLLGRHPGDDFTAASATALTGLTPALTRRILDRIVDEHLVTQVIADRHRLHDLLRAYASEQAAAHDGDHGVGEALGRVLTWYLYAADAAVRLLSPHQRDITLDEQRRPAHLPVFTDDEQAFRWLTAEHATLVAAVTAALDHGMHDLAWQLPAVLRVYFDHIGAWDDWISTNRVALSAARLADDRHGEAVALSILGLAHGQLNKVDEAIEYFVGALTIRRALGDRFREGRALNNLATAYGRQGKFHDAVAYLSEALSITQELDAQYDATYALCNLGRAYTGLAQHEDAIRCIQQAIEIRSRLDDPVGVARALYDLGEALLHAGRHEDAIDRLQDALRTFREKHCPGDEADVLELLGDAFLATGQPVRAKENWRQALSILDELGHPSATDLRARIDQTT